MSATVIHSIGPDSAVIKGGRSIANAFRGTTAISSPIIDQFSTTEERQTYLARAGSTIDPNGDFARDAFKGYILLQDPNWFTRLTERQAVPAFVRSVLMTTFDGAVARKEEIPRLISDMKRFDQEISSPDLPTNLAEQVCCLEELERSDRIIGVCWNPWSGNVDAWRVACAGKTARAYNLALDSGHFFIYDCLVPQ